MDLNEVLDSPRTFDVFYKFVLNWEKGGQSWKQGYGHAVEFMEMLRYLYPTLGRCVRNFFPTFAFTRQQKMVAAASKHRLLPCTAIPCPMESLEDLNWAYLAYAYALQGLRSEVWNEFASSAQGQSMKAELYVIPPAPAVNKPAASAAAFSLVASPAAKVAIAPRAFIDKPVAIVVTPEDSETLLRMRTAEGSNGNSDSLGSLFAGSQASSAVSSRQNLPSAGKLPLPSPPAAAKVPFPAGQKGRIDPHEFKPRSKVPPPLPPLPVVSAIAKSRAVEVALGLPPAVRANAMVRLPGAPPPLPPMPRRKVVPHIQIKRSAQVEVGSLIDSLVST